MITRVAAKRLARVEVSASASNQHEFNAGLLRKALDLPEAKTKGNLEITFVTEDDGDAEVDSSTYTLSNVREGKPRAAEFHMYYGSRRLQKLARPGDILILTRSGASEDLRGLIVRPDTVLGAQMEELLADDGIVINSRFREISTRINHQAAADFFKASLDSSPAPSAEDFMRFADASFIERATNAGKLPSGKEMASEAGKIVEGMAGPQLEDDLFIQWRLDAETVLFKLLESSIGQRQLELMTQRGPVEFGTMMDFMLRFSQSRKSRRGQSLQNHFAALLQRAKIPYTPQCLTENGEKPDFVVPGRAAYADRSFPDDRLRMVACKSVLRERWDQILNEAQRIPEKYLLTVDLTITDPTIADIRRSNVHLFMPAPFRSAAYRHHTNRVEIQTVRQLIDRLRLA